MQTENTIKILTRVKDLINAPEKWTKGALARNRFGHPCNPAYDAATCFCVAGALDRAILDLKILNFSVERTMASTAIKYTVERHYLSPLSNWNDSATHEEVINVLNKTIENLYIASSAGT